MIVDLKGAALRFVSDVGVDDEKEEKGTVVFEVWVDGERRAASGVLHGEDAPARIDVDLRGALGPCLVITDAGDGIDFDHADRRMPQKPLMIAGHRDRCGADRGSAEDIHGTPTTGPPEPRSTDAGSTGRARHPFLFRVPAHGDRPLSF